MKVQSSPSPQKKLRKRTLLAAAAALCLLVAIPVIGAFAASNGDTLNSTDDISVNITLNYKDDSGADKTATGTATGTYSYNYIDDDTLDVILCYDFTYSIDEPDDLAYSYDDSSTTYVLSTYKYSNADSSTSYYSYLIDGDYLEIAKGTTISDITITAVYAEDKDEWVDYTVNCVDEDGNAISSCSYTSWLTYDAVSGEYVYSIGYDWRVEADDGTIYQFDEFDDNNVAYSDSVGYYVTEAYGKDGFTVTATYKESQAWAYMWFYDGDDNNIYYFGDGVTDTFSLTLPTYEDVNEWNGVDTYTASDIASWDVYIVNEDGDEVSVGSYNTGTGFSVDLSSYGYSWDSVGYYALNAYASSTTVTTTTTTTTTTAATTTTTTTSDDDDDDDDDDVCNFYAELWYFPMSYEDRESYTDQSYALSVTSFESHDVNDSVFTFTALEPEIWTDTYTDGDGVVYEYTELCGLTIKITADGEVVQEDDDLLNMIDTLQSWDVYLVSFVDDEEYIYIGNYAKGASVSIDLSEYTDSEGHDWGENVWNYYYLKAYASTKVPSSSGSDSPSTGDDFNAAPFVVLAVISLAAATASATLTYRKKKLAAKTK